MRWLAALLTSLLASALLAGSAHAYTVNSRFGSGCHEYITAQTVLLLLEELQEGLAPDFAVPRDRVTQAFMKEVPNRLPQSATSLTEVQRFLLLSVLIGVRHPDTDGHSLANLHAMRNLHGNPEDKSQYIHALRGKNDDFHEGDRAAVAGTRQAIRAAIALAWSPPAEASARTHRVKVYVDFYGRVDVTVHRAAFHVGLALHTLQDSFSHTLRSDADGLRSIVTVLNYIDAIAPDFDERRDGLAHSVTLDDCFHPAAAELTEAAIQASYELILALQSADPEVALEDFFDTWLSLREGCTLANEFCDNRRWLDLARREQTEPFLDDFFGCQQVRGGTQRGGWLALLLLGAWRLGRRLRRATPPLPGAARPQGDQRRRGCRGS